MSNRLMAGEYGMVQASIIAGQEVQDTPKTLIYVLQEMDTSLSRSLPYQKSTVSGDAATVE